MVNCIGAARALFLCAAGLFSSAAQNTAINLPLTLEQKEEFLKTAEVQRTKGASKGVTHTVRATLEREGLIHDASIQTIEESKAKYETMGQVEFNFRDSWQFNVAAYRLGRLLGLGSMIPPSVERKLDGKSGAWTWWIEGVQMDELERLNRKIDAPDKDRWARQYQIMKVFDELIANKDRNRGNILYDKDWNLWMIDHSRAFRTSKQVLNPKSLERCDRVLLAKMKQLNEATLKTEIGPWVMKAELKAVLARRDEIVQFFEKHPALMYDYLPREEPGAKTPGP